MKNLLLILIVTASVFFVGCSEERRLLGGVDQPHITDPIFPIGGDVYGTNGGLADIQEFGDRLDEMAQVPTNAPTDIKLKLDLYKNSDDTFSGTATVFFTDRGETFSRVFHSGQEDDSIFSRFINDGQQFRAIFDDFRKGMLVVVVDKINQGTGFGRVAKGGVYFHNYDLSPLINGEPPGLHPQFSELGTGGYCWDMTAGRYTCDPYDSADADDTQIYPNIESRRLGEFNNLNIDKALNLNSD